MTKDDTRIDEVMKLIKEIQRLRKQTKRGTEKKAPFSYEELEYENPFFAAYGYTESTDAPEERTF
jgi:hypothetical protein